MRLPRWDFPRMPSTHWKRWFLLAITLHRQIYAHKSALRLTTTEGEILSRGGRGLLRRRASQWQAQRHASISLTAP